LSVALPPGWASRTSAIGQRLLWKSILKRCHELGEAIDAVVVTSPHYHVLLDQVTDRTCTFYYASDDYHSYEGWNQVVALEKQLVRRVDHAFFVSTDLLERAQHDYGVEADKLSVSMNGTEERFFPAAGDACRVPPPSGTFQRPIAGVVGGINERLDYSMLKACADVPELGTLLLVGPLPDSLSKELKELLRHPKCVAVGGQPHETIHRWFQCLDVGLIPYVEADFNRLCSPMRLFDHLASGVPIVATDACAQVASFSDVVDVCPDGASFAQAVRSSIARGADPERISRQLAIARNQTWDYRASSLLSIMKQYEA